MVQVDVFWSYGLASGLALASKKRIKKEPSLWINEPFVATLLWITLIFAPSGMYLLWNFPGWETMFVAATHRDIPAWLVTGFALTNVTQGILGYWVTARLIKAGRDRAATFQTIWSHAAMLFILVVGWDGSGLSRFLYSGTGEDFHSGVSYPWQAWFSGSVFYSLLGMAVFFVPSYVYLLKRLSR